MRKATTWVLVADGARALILAVDQEQQHLELLEEHDSEAARQKTSDQVSDRQGRAFESASPGHRSGMSPRTEPRRHEQERFLGQIAARLLEALRETRYDRLVLVAAPRAVGMLRDQLAEPVAARVVQTHELDLAHLTVPQIETHLRAELLGG